MFGTQDRSERLQSKKDPKIHQTGDSQPEGEKHAPSWFRNMEN